MSADLTRGSGSFTYILISWNQGQACCAGSRIFVQAGIYDEFLKRFTANAQSIKVGDPFSNGVDQGPQVSQTQYDVSNLFYHESCSEILTTQSFNSVFWGTSSPESKLVQRSMQEVNVMVMRDISSSLPSLPT